MAQEGGDARCVFRREIPVRHDVDVFVAGGGPAGCAAALAAARQGRSVFLAERHTCLGGMGTAGMVPLFMQFTDGVNFLAGGIGHEIAERLAWACGFELRDCLAIQAEALKRLYDDLLLEAGVGFTFETALIAVEVVGATHGVAQGEALPRPCEGAAVGATHGVARGEAMPRPCEGAAVGATHGVARGEAMPRPCEGAAVGATHGVAQGEAMPRPCEGAAVGATHGVARGEAMPRPCEGAKAGADRVGLAVLAAKSGLFAVRAKVFIDATGDGDLAAWAGAPFEKGDADGGLMPGTLCSLWANVDWEAVGKGGLGAGESQLEAAFRDGVFSLPDRHLPGMWRVGDGIGGGNIGHTFGVDSTDERLVTKALLWGRKALLEYERYYKEYLKGFEKMSLVATASLLGIRESRRILGDYVLNLEDFRTRAIFADEIGRYAYPVDIHASRPDEANYRKFAEEFRTLRYGRGESYGIPYRVLVPRGLANVLVAGRCVSTDRYIQGSLRVMPGCYITGQAAGLAAALAIEGGTDTRGFPVAELQRRLQKMGAFLPNC